MSLFLIKNYLSSFILITTINVLKFCLFLRLDSDSSAGSESKKVSNPKDGSKVYLPLSD